MQHLSADGIHGSHITLGDSHHTTIDLNPTYIDPAKGMICGHGSVSLNLFTDHRFIPDITANVGLDGCVVANTHGGINLTGLSGIGEPTVSTQIGVHF